MTELTKILILPRALIGTFDNWDGVHFSYLASCHCTSITTDMESYIEVEATEKDCLEELCKDFVKLGFEVDDTIITRERSKARSKE